MLKSNSRMVAAWFALAALAISVAFTVQAQPAAVDPAAVQILKRMTDYTSGLPKFSVRTANTLEDQLDSGQRIDLDVAASVVVRRPDKIHARRVGELISQDFYYDGSTLTLSNPSQGVYATEPAPATIEELLDYVREDLGLLIPVSDLVYRNSYAILMKGVTSATVIGKAVIGGTTCDHLAISRPDVDLQVWVADGDQPLPCKYVVTDKSTPALISTVTVMSDWNTSPAATDADFDFVAPEGAQRITFVPFD